jgi:GntR family transcriptional regulator/MocR family aminotransferase
VIHLGTFSKTLAPGLRIAWLHLPDSLIALARGLKWLSDLHNPPLLQASLAQFMEQGWYELHLRRMRALYRRKRDLAIACLGATGSWTIEGDAAGIHLMVRRRRGPADDAWAARCRQRGVRIYPLGLHRREAPGFDNAFILGFGHLSMDQIVLGCERLNGVPD